MTTLRTTLFAALGLGALAGTASANGFYINEHDAKVTGRAGAVTATVDGPSSVIFNPGGIALSEGTNIAVSASLIAAKGSYFDASNNDERTDTDSSPAVLPSIFVTSRLNDMVAVGVGFHLPFGLALSWPDQHTQADVLQDQALRTYFITPAVGLNLNKFVPGLSIGGGLDLVPATVELERAIVFGDTRGTADLGGDAFGIGGRAGVQYQPAALKQLRIGAMWRSPGQPRLQGQGRLRHRPGVPRAAAARRRHHDLDQAAAVVRRRRRLQRDPRARARGQRDVDQLVEVRRARDRAAGRRRRR